MKTTQRPVRLHCTACRNYYITWDPRHPYGCRVLGFKSRAMPIRIVRQSTPGINCQWFAPQRRRRRSS